MSRRISPASIAGFAVPVALLALPSAPVFGQDAQSVLQTMVEREAARWETVDNYTIVQSVEVAAGLQTPQYFVKMEVDGQPTFRLVPAPVYEGEMMTAAGFPPPGPEVYEGMAMTYGLLGAALEQGGGDQPPMPGASQMADRMALFMQMGAEGLRNMDDGSADAEQSVADMQRFASMARLDGTEAAQADEDGGTRDAYRIVVDGLEMTQEAPGGSYTLHTATIWIATDEYVPLRMLMEGEVASDGQTSPLNIEKLNLDYQHDGPLYVPHREVYRLTGIMSAMSDDDRKQMEEARAQLDEVEAQLANMPDGPGKQMAERAMRPQIERFRKMVEGEAFETATNVVSVAVNEGPPTPYGLGEVNLEGTHGALTMASEGSGVGGALVGALSVESALDGAGMANFTVGGSLAFPEEGGSMTIVAGSGSVDYADGRKLSVESATGSVTVDDRTDTHVSGTFDALLTGTDPDGNQATAAVTGTYDSGAPAGPYQAPRGSPIPAMFGMTN